MPTQAQLCVLACWAHHCMHAVGGAHDVEPLWPSAGVEHLLRDVKDATVSTLAAEVGTLTAGLGGLRSRLLQMQEYLGAVVASRLPVNHDILYQLQARAA